MQQTQDLFAGIATPALPRVLLVLPPHAGADDLPFAATVHDRQLPFTVSTAFGACEALRLAKEERCDVIISEYLLGKTTVFDILAHAPRDMVIVVTADGDEVTAINAFKAGACDYIIKDASGEYLDRIPEAIDRALRSRASHSLYQTLIHAMTSIHDSVFITDMNDTIIFTNNAFCKTYGYETGEIIGKNVVQVWGEETKSEFIPAKKIAASGHVAAKDTSNLRKDGTTFPVSLSRSVVHNEEGEAQAVVCVARDITERVHAEQELKNSLNEKEVLLREIHHRVKNNLQIISSLLNLQAGFLKDQHTRDALRESQNRVRSMALIHERIYRSGRLSKVNFPEYVQSLANHLLSSYRGARGVTIQVEQTELLINVELAVPCGLIVNELLSNSLKHGYPKGRNGAIHVRFSVDETDQSVLTLEVADDGVGYPANLDLDNTESLGLQLINMLSQQLKGSLTIIHDTGARSLIKIPLAN